MSANTLALMANEPAAGDLPPSERLRLETELEKVRKQLDSQVTAGRIARETASNALGQLKSIEFDNQLVRLELERTRGQLGQAQQLHDAVSRQAAEKEASLRNELVAVRHEVALSTRSKAVNRNKLLIPTFLLALAALAWAAVAQWHLLDSQGGLLSKATEAATPAQPETTAGGTSGGAPDLVDAIGRLDRAMDRFGSAAKPEEVLRLVHKQGLAKGVSVCSFAWNGGQVSLVFGGKTTEDLPTAILHCAEAVENTAR